MITNYIGTYTIDVAKGLAETYMRNQLISSFNSTFITIIIVVATLYCLTTIIKVLCSNT